MKSVLDKLPYDICTFFLVFVSDVAKCGSFLNSPLLLLYTILFLVMFKTSSNISLIGFKGARSFLNVRQNITFYLAFF